MSIDHHHPRRLSVALCTFNGAAHLPRQLHSLARQQRLPDELVVFDDASTDGTVAILREFAASAQFPVMVNVNQGTLGTTRNFESAIAACSGEVIATCDQDDVWYPEKLARIECAFSAKDMPDLVFSDADIVDGTLRPLGYRLWRSIGFGPREQSLAAAGRLLSVLVRFNAVTGAAMAFTAKWRSLLLPLPAGWVHDGWIALLLAAAGKCTAIADPLVAYRQHSAQQIGGGPASLRGQIARARAMDRDYFQRLESNFTAALDRLSSAHIDGNCRQLLQAKITHCRERAAMRAPGNSRLSRIISESLAGRYGACSLGWKSIAQDLWMT